VYHFIIVGSGVGGSTLFKELNEKYPDKRILLLEMGDERIKYNTLKGEVQVLYITSLGGSGLGAVGNAMRIDLRKVGIRDSEIYQEVERELKVREVPDSHIRESIRPLFDYGFRRTPKFIDFKGCTSCGMCARKICPYKWTPRRFLNVQNPSSKIVTNFYVSSISKEGNLLKVEGFHLLSGKRRVFQGERVIVCGGGINSPRILSTILDNEHLGRNLFVDIFLTVGGVLENCNLDRSVPMALYRRYDGFLLSPHYTFHLYRSIKRERRDVGSGDIYGIMVKIGDEGKGFVKGNRVYKGVSERDEKLLSRGIEEASKILGDMGVERIYRTVLRGSHPGGTCAMGKVVDKNFETEVENLYVCDASVFPESPGLPPILGIVAMGKKLGSIL